MSNMITVPLNEASNIQLRWYASTALNIDGIKSGQQNGVLIGKIKAVAPDLEQIAVPEFLEADPTTGVIQVGAPTPPDAPAIISTLHPRQAAHYRFDPKVKVFVGEAYDGTRVKEVQLSVCGDTLTIKRGSTVEIPYRFYLALQQSIERFFRDTDEMNPLTGMPIKEIVERPTVAHSLAGPLPSAEEIAEFHKRTDAVSL